MSVEKLAQDLDIAVKGVSYMTPSNWTKVKNLQGISQEEMQLVAETLKAIYPRIFKKPFVAGARKDVEGKLSALTEKFSVFDDAGWQFIIESTDILPPRVARALLNIFNRVISKAESRMMELMFE